MPETTISSVERRNQLVEAHLPLVAPIARRLARNLPKKFEVEELNATGYLGLIQAAGRYRPREHGGAPFSAFARKSIRGYILQSIRGGKYLEAMHLAVEDEPEPIVPCAIESVIDTGRLVWRVDTAVAKLPHRHRSVVEMHYRSEMRLPAVGHSFGVGKSRASQIHMDAIRALRSRLAV